MSNISSKGRFGGWLVPQTLFFFFYKFIYLFIFAVLGLRFCARAFSSCGEQGPLFIAVHGPLTIETSVVAEHRLQTLRLSSCGSRAQLLHGMWDLPRPGLEPVCPALAGRFSTTAPPGKPSTNSSSHNVYPSQYVLSAPSSIFNIHWEPVFQTPAFFRSGTITVHVKNVYP